ncbi:MAG: aminotransferase class V-fold PLP-dependent enzyme, partial [Clostridia bacterium]|nr:aminotransferase class V-fold PLP-dependent enzyme [Clostridia bacterium]
EDNASSLFGTAKTLYSTEGSSLCIRAMLFLAKLYGKKPLIAAGRNAHKAFMSAAALCDFEVDWLCPENAGVISCEITPDFVENYLANNKPSAVYITSPDYLGNVLPVGEIAKVCHKHGVLLLVDNAHGAYMRFLEKDTHPITLGADMCCDSAHKTLPVLTGGAYLHISENADKMLCEQAENALSLFASTSPSYLILQSLDKANEYLETYGEKLKTFEKNVLQLKERLEGYTLVGDEPLKITLETKPYGYTGEEFAKLLEKQGVVCEFSDPDYTVMMLTPETDLCILSKALIAIPKREAITEKAPPLTVCQKVFSIREAVFSQSEELPVSLCNGRVLSDTAVACPPAIPIVVCGERIDENAVKLFKYYGINSCRVVKK